MSRRIIVLYALLLATGISCVAVAASGTQEGKASQGQAMTPAPTSTAPSSGAAAPAAPPAPAIAQPAAGTSNTASGSTGAGASVTSATARVQEREDALIEGEKRFATNCGRCHQSPHHFPPRVIATAVRHMRVRATITDEDMRLILKYLTQ